MAAFVEQPIVLQYLGFETKGALREYAFSLRGHARYQDAPAICSIRLRREFSTQAGHPASSTFSVTDAELAAYKDAHTPKARPGRSKPREDKNF